MNTFSEYTKSNQDKIRKISEANSVMTKEGVLVIGKNDPWRKETEWETLCDTKRK